MPRYIIFSFLIMGWAFYEMSGGADFQPRSAMQTADVTEDRTVPARAAPAPILVTQVNRDDAKKLVTKAAIKTSLAKIKKSDPADVLKDNAAAFAAADNEAKLVQVRASLQQGLPLIDQGTGTGTIQLASLATPSIASDANVEPVETAVRAPVVAGTDLREVLATRVNMRAGPGTSHGIITRVSRGQKVEVLTDNGDGWLRLRTLPGDRVGWIAARLLSEPTR
ncbi:SH3 domain-containing protein [Arenibacterium sp. CAU 1754]